jgi:hypothetical protein
MAGQAIGLLNDEWGRITNFFVKKLFDTAVGGEFLMSNSLKELIYKIYIFLGMDLSINFDFF